MRIEAYGEQGLKDLVKEMGQPHYRATQLFEWLYGHGARSYAEMTNLPGALRERLGAEAPFSFPEIIDKRVSADSTRKYILKLADGALVETVGIPSGGGAGDAGSAAKRLTVCFSTQVGCAMACTFCATGREGFVRNLFPGEMAWQVIAVADDFGMRVSNAVAMGQGEPFANYDHVLSALRILNHEKGLGIGARHITVSTCGIADRIRRFGSEAEQFTLAVSLHSAVQEVRNALMPGVAGTPLPALWDALRDYQERSGRRVTFEYLLAEGANSTDDALAALIDFCSGLSAHVNLLPVNAVDGSPLSPCPPERMGLWRARLERAGIEASVRTSRGADVFGACGQLKNARASS